MREEIAELKTIRPGRIIYVRKIVLGNPSYTTMNLIAVHGTNGTQEHFSSMIEAMSNLDFREHGVNFWCYDMVGCGQSPPLANDDDLNGYCDEESVLDLKAIITDLVDTTHPSYLIGHSYGPTIIMKLLAQFDIEDLYGMIFISSALRGGPLNVPDGGPWIIRNLPLFVLECLKPLMDNVFLKKTFHEETDPFLVEESRQRLKKSDMKVARAYILNHQWPSVAEAQVANNFPMMILHGAEDNLIAPACGQHVANSLDRSKLQFIERSSHFPMLEQPEKVASHVLDFLVQIQCVYAVRDGFPPMS